MISQCLADQLLFASAFGFGIIDLLATDKSQYFAQPRPIIASYPWACQKVFYVGSLK